jgi:hypothetical protein
MVGVGGLIALLLVLRFRLTRRRRANPQMIQTSEARESSDQQSRSFDL